MLALRKIVEIDEEKCDGCGVCVPSCAEGALAIVEGKARLVGDAFCDGLGACLGDCPQGAITIVEREAAPFDEALVEGSRQTASEPEPPPVPGPPFACPGATARSFGGAPSGEGPGAPAARSELRQWPIQLHLVSPRAPYFQGADVLLAADCVAYALGGFHGRLKERSLAIACPKLDDGQEIYAQKIRDLVDGAKIETLRVFIMEVPCCRGLLNLARTAVTSASRRIPVQVVVVGVEGGIRHEEWL